MKTFEVNRIVVLQANGIWYINVNCIHLVLSTFFVLHTPALIVSAFLFHRHIFIVCKCCRVRRVSMCVCGCVLVRSIHFIFNAPSTAILHIFHRFCALYSVAKHSKLHNIQLSQTSSRDIRLPPF